MINRNRIDSLVKHHSEEHPVVSLYVNVEWPKKFASELNSLVRNKIKELHESRRFSQEEREKLEELLLRMERSVKERKDYASGTRMVAVFADTQALWEEYELPVKYPNRLVIDHTPYSRLLVAARDNFARFCVLVGSSRKARLFTYQGGKLQEEELLFSGETPEGTNDEALKGFGEQHLERSEREQVYRNIREIAARLFDVFKRDGYDYLILGAPQDRELPLLRDHLHSYLQQRIVGEFNGRPEDDRESILRSVRETTERWERQKEREFLDHLAAESYDGGKAVRGVGPTLKALMNGQVHTLAIRDAYSREGYACPKDHYLDLSSRECPLCGQRLHKVEDIVDEMVEETLQQNGEVRYIQHFSEELDRDGVAARLRFVV
jgi:hypothetical protein